MTLQSVVRNVPRAVAAVFVVTAVAGCHTMARVPARYITVERPEQVFVRDAEGSIFSVSHPTIVRDSLIGTDAEGAVAVNLREVDAMAVRQVSKSKTAGMVAASAGILGMVTFGISKATSAKDCLRIANRNNTCLGENASCKYSACTAEQGTGDGSP